MADDATAPVSARSDGLPGAPPGSALSPGLGPLQRLRGHVIDFTVARRSRRAEARLRANPVLWGLLTRAAADTAVTGASYSDYWTLYDQVRTHRPVEILEMGTGISTVAMAQALRENEAEGAPRGRVTSMEEDAYWHTQAVGRLPDEVRPYVEILHSPKIDGFYKCFRGVQYQAIPDRPYDFVFSDGPERHSPVNGDKLFDLDLIHVVRRSERPVRALVDDHYLTFYVLQKVFGPKLARYSVAHRLLFVGPVTRSDVRFLRHENFLPDLRLARPTVFRLRMSRADGDS
ncbi:MAG: class I SAM-dependent methyltransferase [Alphaproteobacteria bacterium]